MPDTTSQTDDTHGGATDLVGVCEEFLTTYYREDIAQLAQHYPREQKSLRVSWGDLLQKDPDLADDLLDNPNEVISALEAALANVPLPADVNLSKAHVRVTGLHESDTYGVGAYRSDQIGDYLAVEGQISKVTQVKPEIEHAAFECQRCGTMTRIPQSGDDYQEPHECQGCERQGPFSINFEHSEFIDHQGIRLQQPPEETQGGQGATVDVHLRDDLAAKLNADGGFQAGDRVTIAGQYRVAAPENGRTFDQFIDGEAVDVDETSFKDVDLDDDLRERVQALAAGEEGDPYDLLVDSLAPTHQGHDAIKLALVLQMFGGNRVSMPDGEQRGNSHILLLGDPGVGKTSLMRSVETIAPRSTYASGKGASAAGMTAAAVPDDIGDAKWSLEAGALVLANGGIACVDEIDKIQEDAVQSMHEALESQQVSVNKAGINATLPARTALLAAGNPTHGRFNRYESMAEQIDLDPPLLSRFDLIYLLSDQPDRESDRSVGENIIRNRQIAIADNRGDDVDEADLDSISPAVDPEVVRAWVALAKQTTQPAVTDEGVMGQLRDYYTELRMANGGEDEDGPVPVTPRKIQSILRLAEASARVRFSETVTQADIRRATELVGKSMQDVGVDPETGELDADIVETGNAKSQRERRRAIKEIIGDLAAEHESGAPEEKVLGRATETGMKVSKAEHEIEQLRQQGEVYEPQEGHLRTTSGSL